MTQRERAEEMIDNYALGHAATAFGVGMLGGQFGADRIALTALTVKMINDICDVYGITDKAAKAIHVASAIGRLTVRGTVIAHTILNWVPFFGPAANSGTTYYLTKKAGQECINDIERDRMTVGGQLSVATGRVGTMVLAHEIADFSTDIATKITDTGAEAIDHACAEATDAVSASHAEIVDGVRNVLISPTIINAEKEFIEKTIAGVANNALSGESLDLGAIFKSSLSQAVLVGGLDLGTELFDSHKDAFVQRLEVLRRFLPESVRTEIDQAMTEYKQVQGDEDRKVALDKVMQTIQAASTIRAESLSFFKTLCTHFDCTQFRKGVVPFNDGGIHSIKEKLAYLTYSAGFSNDPDRNWWVGERLLWSKDVLAAITAYIKNMSLRGERDHSELSIAIQSTLADWQLIPNSYSFVSNFSLAILADDDLLAAFAVRVPMIAKYVDSCSLAAYGMHLHVQNTEKSHWVFSETFAKVLSSRITEKHTTLNELLSDINLLSDVLKESLSLLTLHSQPVSPYLKLLSENLFLEGTFEMASLLRADAGQ